MRAREVLRWALIATYAVLWTGGIVSQGLWPDIEQPAWAAPLFLFLAAAIAALCAGRPAPAVIFGAGGFLAELAGVHTGVPFGRYQYSGALGPSVGGVPLAIACAWLTLLIFARELAWRITSGRWAAAAAGAAIMTALDLLIDPVATRILGYWRWQQEGVYFGVPWINFIGWFAVSAVLLSLVSRPSTRSDGAIALGSSVVLFFALIAVAA